jgi:hypothetical protein
MNNLKYIPVLLIVLFSKSLSAQESFLRLDSIVIKETTLTPSYLYQSTVIEAYDTMSFTVNASQVVNLRNCAMSLTNISSYPDTYILDNSSERILDSRIEINEFNIFSTHNLLPPSSAADYRGSYSSYQLRTEGFAGVSNVDLFLNPGTHEVVFHFKGVSLAPEIRGRIELIYYSIE